MGNQLAEFYRALLKFLVLNAVRYAGIRVSVAMFPCGTWRGLPLLSLHSGLTLCTCIASLSGGSRLPGCACCARYAGVARLSGGSGRAGLSSLTRRARGSGRARLSGRACWALHGSCWSYCGCTSAKNQNESEGGYR